MAEDAFLGSAAVVPARGDFDRGQVAAFAGRMVPGGDRGGVGSDVAGPALEQPAAVGEVDGDQHEAVADLLQQGPAVGVFGICVLPRRPHGGGLLGGQAPPVAAVRVERGG